jgi:dipeptidyl-peptidase-3
MDAYNSRVFKDSETNTFEIRFASILSTEDKQDSDYLQLKQNELNGAKFVLSRGDYSPLLRLLNKYLSDAKTFAQNETEKQMIDRYLYHFLSGDLKAHKDGSRFWIKDKGPIVETYIGFIENYRDPAGMRAEFEGLSALLFGAILSTIVFS